MVANFRARKDVIARPLRSGATRRWIVKDPVALEYYQFGEDEWFLYCLLDGTHMPSEIRALYDRQFAPQRLAQSQLDSFCNRLRTDGLLLTDSYGQGEIQLRRRAKQRLDRSIERLIRPLAIRLPGFDPTGVIDFVEPVGSVLFHPAYVLLVAVMALAAAVTVLSNIHAFLASLPSIASLTLPENLWWLLLALGLTKSFHEFGHALACRRFGGHCHEIGVMLLAFTPCLYADVSDSWLFRKRAHRVYVALAGIYFEIMLASVCVFLWHASEPGVLNSLFLNFILVCTVSTVLVNGNPLLHYDGYYVLADVWDVSNLSEQSRQALWQPIGNWLLGRSQRSLRLDGNRCLLAIYALCSSVYRCFIIGLILWVAYRTLKSYELRFLGDILVVVTLSGIVIPPLRRTMQRLATPAMRGFIHWGRLILLIGVLLIVGYVVCAYPMGHHLSAPAVVEINDAHYVYAQAPGVLDECASEGEVVRRGDLIARLHNYELSQDALKLDGEVRQLSRRLESLRLQTANDPNLLTHIPTLETLLTEQHRRLDALKEDLQRLVIIAPAAGTIIPAPQRPRRPSTDVLPDWSGTPLDPSNRTCHIETGDLLCLVGDPKQFQALLLVDQSDINLVQAGQDVTIRLDLLPHADLTGRVIEIARGEFKDRSHPSDHVHGRHPIPKTNPGLLQSFSTTYFVRVELESQLRVAVHGCRGMGKIEIGHTTLGGLFARHLGRVFRFRL